MFSVKPLGQNNPNNIPILNGINFGYFDMPLFFEIRHENIDSPLILEFVVRNDKTKKSNQIEFTPISNNIWRIFYYNPSLGKSGLVAPIGPQLINNNIFGFMFHIDTLENSNCYKISYEFYNGTDPK